jgi:hypothetical protein
MQASFGDRMIVGTGADIRHVRGLNGAWRDRYHRSMPAALAIVLPLTLGVVLIASAVGKFRTPDDLAGWAELGVPTAFRREWMRRLHPWGELVLGVLVAVLGGVLGVLVSLVAVVLMAAYTWLVARVAGRADDTSCACFGARKKVTKVTVVRNVWLTLLAVASAAVAWAGPVFGGAIAGLGTSGGWSAVLASAVAAVTGALILWPEGGEDHDHAAASADPGVGIVASRSEGTAADDDAGEQLDYIRTRTPAVPVTTADGSVHNLRTLTSSRPVMLLAVSPTCAACQSVIAKTGEWRELLPEIDIRFLLRTPPEQSGLIEHEEPQSLHDPEGYVNGSIQDWPTPTAVLLGADGMLAGGPVIGHGAIEQFIGDVYESLHGEPLPATV